MGWILDLLKELPLSAVQREKISNLETEMDGLRKRNAELEKEKADLLKELIEAHKKIAELEAPPQNFVKHKGAFFERRPDGSYDETVYCFHCRSPMSCQTMIQPYKCSKCAYKTPFLGREIVTVLKGLPKSEA